MQRHQRGPAARLPQPVRLLEGRGRPVRARLRAHLRPAGRRLPDELHLRPAPVRHGRPGLGRALPDPRAATASRSRSTATACRCATSSSSTTWSTLPAGAGAHRRASPGRRSTSAAARTNASACSNCSSSSASSTGGDPARRSTAWRAGDQRYYVSDTRRFEERTGWAPRVGVGEGVRALHDWLRADPRRRAGAQPLDGRRIASMKFALINPALDASRAASTSAAASRTCRSNSATRRPCSSGRARGPDRRRRSSSGLTRDADRARRRAIRARTSTVVTTAPSYLFWRCAPPELRVPQRARRDLATSPARIVVVGPHASTTPRRHASQARRGRRDHGRVRGHPAAAGRRARRSGAASRRCAAWDDDGPRAGRTARDRHGGTAGAALARRRRSRRTRHHHHRFDAAPVGPGAEMESSRGCPYHCTLLREGQLPQRLSQAAAAA